MLKKLFPTEYLDSVFLIDYHKLWENNIRGLIFDIDNTLVPFDIEAPPKEINELFEKLKAIGFKICLVSNNSNKRVSLFNKNLSFPAVSRALKPRLKGINQALSFIQTDASNTVLIGDQIFTDVWGANRKKIHVILVKPIATRDEFTVKLKRKIEKFIIKKYFKFKEME
ncbi:MAG: YqeG family HAD IIIA-type phosphatase [Defluviitaleaceae bacterium]|nr:YqeG family HAD IIIA-type phosphatase [Defluviitaleaceae bacterium]